MSRMSFAPSVIRAVASLEAIFACMRAVDSENRNLAAKAESVFEDEGHNYKRYMSGYHELDAGSFDRDVQILVEQRRIDRKMKAQARNAAKLRMNKALDELAFG